MTRRTYVAHTYMYISVKAGILEITMAAMYIQTVCIELCLILKAFHYQLNNVIDASMFVHIYYII